MNLPAPSAVWPLLFAALPQVTESDFRRHLKGEMGKPGRTYAALGEAMGIDADDARKVARGVLRPYLHQVIGAARYFATFYGEA